MRNCLILGSGRSGTSLVAGVLAEAGYFMGTQLLPADPGNPKGYFEDWAINQLNDDLIGQVVPLRPPGWLGDWLYPRRVPRWQRWLAVVPPSVNIPTRPTSERRIRELVRRQEPFGYKDPRFCYTLPIWRPYVTEAVLVCVFRHPAVTAQSMLTECQRDRHLRRFQFDVHQALAVWEAMYRQVLDVHVPAGGEWVFLHYDQLLSGQAFDRLAAALAAPVTPQFVDPRLSRSRPQAVLPAALQTLYARLCEKAGYED